MHLPRSAFRPFWGRYRDGQYQNSGLVGGKSAGLYRRKIAAERFEKLDELVLLFFRQIDGPDQRTQTLVLEAAPGIPGDYLFERLQLAAVHVGARVRDVSQRRRLEVP